MTNTSSRLFSYNPGSSYPIKVKYEYTAPSALYTGTLKYRYTIPGLADVSHATRKLAFLRKKTGLDRPVAIAWEAVPYSFIADYFSNVGSVIGSYLFELEGPLDPIITLLDYTESVRVTVSQKKYLDYWGLNGYCYAGESEMTLYQRRRAPVKVVFSPDLTFHGLSFRSIINSTALLAVKSKKIKSLFVKAKPRAVKRKRPRPLRNFFKRDPKTGNIQ